MTKQNESSRTSRYAHSLRYVLLVIELWCISMFASMSILATQQVYAQSHDSIPGGNVSDPVIRAVDIAKPAVVRIWTDVPGHLTVHFPPTTDVSFPQKSNGNYRLAFTGTGTFISSQGDVLTADHVVQPPKKETLDPALYSAAAQDVANYMNQNTNTGSTQVSASDVVQQLTSGQLSSSTAYDSSTIRVYLSTDYVGTFKASDLKSVPSNLMATVDATKAQSSPDQQDLAIVHVPMTDTPSVALGNSDNVQQQDQLTIIGFPGNADVSQKPQDFLASSTKRVFVSSKKTSDSGAPLIQVDGNIDSGDDGAPALNSQGEVVGIVSLGLSTARSNSTIFLQASRSALNLAQGIKLDMTPGPFQTLWSQAFNDYAATTPGHWHKAVQGFTQLTQSYPQFQAVQPFLSYARTQAETESTNAVSATPTEVHNTGSVPSVVRPPSLAPWQAWAIIIGSVVLLLVLAVSLFAVTRRKRERKTMSTPRVGGSKNGSVMAAPKSSESPTMKNQSPVSQGGGQSTLSLRAWPCGHLNRASARFCSVCGEAAPDK